MFIRQPCKFLPGYPGRTTELAYLLDAVDGRVLCVANADGKISAMDNVCLHRGGPLGEGQLEGKVVTCPWHGWQYDVTTGKTVQNPNAGVGCYATEIRGDEVFINLA